MSHVDSHFAGSAFATSHLSPTPPRPARVKAEKRRRRRRRRRRVSHGILEVSPPLMDVQLGDIRATHTTDALYKDSSSGRRRCRPVSNALLEAFGCTGHEGRAVLLSQAECIYGGSMHFVWVNTK